MPGKSYKNSSLKGELFASLAVIFGITYVIPVAIFLINKNKFVRFYCLQSLVFFTVFVIIQWLSQFSTKLIFDVFSISLPIVPLVTVTAFIVWLLMVYKAWMGDTWKVPFIGVLTDKIIKSIKK